MIKDDNNRYYQIYIKANGIYVWDRWIDGGYLELVEFLKTLKRESYAVSVTVGRLISLKDLKLFEGANGEYPNIFTNPNFPYFDKDGKDIK